MSVPTDRAPAPLPDLAAVATSVDAVLGTVPAPTECLVPRDGPVMRLGLALDAGPSLLPWVTAQALDAVLLHRHWALRRERWPAGVGLLANHDAFDRRLGFGCNPELAATLDLALAVSADATLGARDGWPLGTVGTGTPRSPGALRAAIVATFGGIENAMVPDDLDGGAITRVAMARAMTPATVAAAVAAGAQAYVTGELRASGHTPALRARLAVFAVGHRRSERWALGLLADLLRARWPALTVMLAPDAPTD